ncbi:putative HNHc nuclease [Amedibacillus sp. YH-ame6]
MARISKKDGNYILNDYRLKTTDDMFLDCGESIEVDVQISDKRIISDQQRKFIFALCNDMEYYTGSDSEYMRLVMQQYNADLREIEIESLSNCSVTYANGLISTIINFCIDKEIPITRKNIDDYGYSFSEKQTYTMALKRICVICGRRADIHHVDHIGMGNDRKAVSHVGKRSLPLCREHHRECHTVGEETFITRYHLTPFIIDEKMEYFIKKGKLKTHE